MICLEINQIPIYSLHQVKILHFIQFIVWPVFEPTVGQLNNSFYLPIEYLFQCTPWLA